MPEYAPRIVTLDSHEQAAFETGAILLSILAFPAPAEEEASKKAAEALCADVLRVTVANYPDRAADWRVAYPVYAVIDKAESRRRLRTLRRRLRDRMVASRMSLGFFEEGITGRPARLPPAMLRLSLNQLSELVQSQSGESITENIERRAWRDSRPVIHLAAAMQIVIRAMAPDQEAVGYP